MLPKTKKWGFPTSVTALTGQRSGLRQCTKKLYRCQTGLAAFAGFIPDMAVNHLVVSLDRGSIFRRSIPNIAEPTGKNRSIRPEYPEGQLQKKPDKQKQYSENEKKTKHTLSSGKAIPNDRHG